MKEKPYKFTKKDKEDIGGLCRFLLAIAKDGPIKEMNFKYTEDKKFNIGTLTFSRQREFSNKQIFDIVKVVKKTKKK